MLPDKLKLSDLRCPITVQGRTRTADAIGGFTQTPINRGTTRAYIEAASAGEAWRGARTKEVVTHTIIIRKGAISGLTADDIVIYDGRKFSIKAVNDINEGRSWFTELGVVEGDPVGQGM